MHLRHLLAAAAPFLAVPAARAQGDVPLTELLGSTDIHEIAVDRADPLRLFTATHHGLYALRLNATTVENVSAAMRKAWRGCPALICSCLV
jgi:hypothetical protein